MNKVTASVFLSWALLLSIMASGQSIKERDTLNKIKPLPRNLEIQLALSALPPHLRDSATVYVLNPDRGFVLAQKGKNGFCAFVARTGDDAMRGSWVLTKYRQDILYPVSFDEAGSRAQMRVFFDIAAMQTKGIPPQKAKEIIQSRYKTRYYRSPERAGVSYMLSPILRTYTNPDSSEDVVTLSIPHVMYYAPNVSNKDIGGARPGGEYPFIILHGAHGYTIQLLGVTERAAVKKDYEELLAKLCDINKDWCLSPDTVSQSMEHRH